MTNLAHALAKNKNLTALNLRGTHLLLGLLAAHWFY